MFRESQIEALLQPTIEAMGYELWGVQLSSRGHDALLRIYIDQDAGINVEDCAKVSRQVSAILDVEDPISSHYTLEVSSPGLDRPLFKVDQYQRYLGQQLKLRLMTKHLGQKKWVGILSSIKDENIVLRVINGKEEQEIEIPFAQIERANLIEDF